MCFYLGPGGAGGGRALRRGGRAAQGFFCRMAGSAPQSLIPGGHRLNTAEMLEEAGRHVKFLQAQVALMHTIRNDKMPSMAQEQMHALLVCGSVQERLAAEGKFLVPRRVVDTMAKDNAIKSNALVNRNLNRFMQSLDTESVMAAVRACVQCMVVLF